MRLFAVAGVHHLRVHALLHGEPSEQGPVDEILVLLDAVPVPAARVHDHVGVPRRAGNLEAPPERPRAPRAAPSRAAHLGRKLVTPRGRWSVLRTRLPGSKRFAKRLVVELARPDGVLVPPRVRDDIFTHQPLEERRVVDASTRERVAERRQGGGGADALFF